jgi:hypothetical protein
MKNAIQRSFLFVLSSIIMPLSLSARVVLPGNASNSTSTFNVPASIFLGRGDGLITTGAASIGAGAFSVAQLNRVTTIFEGLTPETTALNGTADTPNPLFNVAIAQLTLFPPMNENSIMVPCVAVPTLQPNVAYLIERSKNILSCTTINDANGAQTSGIIALEGSVMDRVFAAVNPNTGEFGAPGSGITFLAIQKIPVQEGDKETTITQFVALPSATPLDPTVNGVFIGNPLSSLTAPITLWWDTVWAQRNAGSIQTVPVYCGIGTVVAGVQPTDGACSVVRVANAKTTIFVAPIFDASANFSDAGTDKIIIATGSDVTLSVHSLSTMWTSTDLRYLIVAGGNGDLATTQSSVYALPLVISGDDEGLLASKTNIALPALVSSDLVTSSDIAGQVGDGPLTAGPIGQLSVRHDTVYATVTTGDFQGIYASQALFASDGTIIAWTQWSRAQSTPGTLLASSLSLTNGNWIVLTSDDPNGANTPNTVTSTVWGDGDPLSFGPAITHIDALFPANLGGVQGLETFNALIPGLSNTALLGVYGRNTIALVETGIFEGNGIYTLIDPATYDNVLVCSDGTVTVAPTDQTIFACTGGLLNDIGPLTSVAIGNSTTSTDSWLFVGGTYGLAVSASPGTGVGWGNALGNNFAGITVGMQFLRVADYAFVKKLITAENFLYILTDTSLDRMDLSAGVLNPQIVTIAQISDCPGLRSFDIFTDCIVSDSLALLATTNGLYRIADGGRVTDAQPSWTRVTLPEQEEPVTLLISVTATGNSSDLATQNGGNLYVLSGNESHNRTVVNRLAVSPLNGAPVSSNTVQPFTSDSYVIGVISYCINYGQFQNLFALDGARVYAVRNNSFVSNSTLYLLSLSRPMRSHARFIGVHAPAIPNTASPGATISAILEQNASGAWMLGTTEGVRINE